MAHTSRGTTTSKKQSEPTTKEMLRMAHEPSIKSAKHGWYMGIRGDSENREDFFYLHKDGKIRGTATSGGKFTGYWPTEAEARAFHANWKQSFTTKHDDEEKERRINAFKERRGNKISMRDIIDKLKEG